MKLLLLILMTFIGASNNAIAFPDPSCNNAYNISLQAKFHSLLEKFQSFKHPVEGGHIRLVRSNISSRPEDYTFNYIAEFVSADSSVIKKAAHVSANFYAHYFKGNSIYIDKDFQGLGIGTEIYKLYAQILAPNEYIEMIVTNKPSRERLVQMLKKLQSSPNAPALEQFESVQRFQDSSPIHIYIEEEMTKLINLSKDQKAPLWINVLRKSGFQKFKFELYPRFDVEDNWIELSDATWILKAYR